MKRLLRAPLLHLVVLGAVLFVVWTRVGGRAGGGAGVAPVEPGKIVVSQAEIARLATGFDRVHGRPASPDELDGLVRDRIREEVYYREALALGLDRDDSVIRNRLRVKMELIADDVGVLPEPSDQALRAYLESHTDAFRIEPRLSFSHVYLDPERHRGRLESDGARLLEELRAGGDHADAATLGDPFLLSSSFDALPRGEVAALFGEPFAARVSELAIGQWNGPIESGYGAHLVRVTQRTPGRVPELGEVGDAVRREWANTERLNARERFYAGLLERYAVTVEPPEPGRGGNALAAETR